MMTQILDCIFALGQPVLVLLWLLYISVDVLWRYESKNKPAAKVESKFNFEKSNSKKQPTNIQTNFWIKYVSSLKLPVFVRRPAEQHGEI